MSYVGVDWPPTDPASKKPYVYDFTGRLPAGDSVTAVTWELKVAPTSVFTAGDPDPSAHISAPGFSGPQASCWLDGLIANCRYKLTAFVTTAAGVEDDLFAYIVCYPRP